MENRAIPDSSITAFTSWGNGHEPWRGRLNNLPTQPNKPHVDIAAYAAGANRQGEWFQVDLRQVKWVTKVATQGRPAATGGGQRITKYKIAFSEAGIQWNQYTENGVEKVSSRQ